ncbi:hypothetical protein D3C85_1141760 [compost metagenome]
MAVLCKAAIRRLAASPEVRSSLPMPHRPTEGWLSFWAISSRICWTRFSRNWSEGSMSSISGTSVTSSRPRRFAVS